MGIQSFKELLLKKSVGNKSLSDFVLGLSEDDLEAQLLEALEKMARPTAGTGRRANGPLVTYASHLDDSDIMQLRDALSHHVSHYKAALKNMHAAPEGSPERTQMRSVADKHLNHLIPLMHLAAKASAHSGGRMAFDYIKELAAWETNYRTLERRPETGKYKTDTDKLGARPSRTAKVRGLPDYHYLEMPPHPGHPYVESMSHESGYPWEEIQIGSPQDVENKQAYLHIEDVPDKKDYTPHPFDQHPMRQGVKALNGQRAGEPVQDLNEDYMGDGTRQQFAEDLANWKSGEHHMKWLDDQEAAYNKDPAAFQMRGKVKPAHVYEGMPLLPNPAHVHDYPKRTRRTPEEIAQQARASVDARRGSGEQSAPATPAAAPVKAAGFTVRKPLSPDAAARVAEKMASLKSTNLAQPAAAPAPEVPKKDGE